MELTTKDDWQEAEERMHAWWAGEIIDRPVIQVRAPKAGVEAEELAALSKPGNLPPTEKDAWFRDIDQVTERNAQIAEKTFWGGEAFPVVNPVATNLVAILSAYFGCPYHIDYHSNSGWAEPIIEDWAGRAPIEFDPDNEWWLWSKRIIDAAARRAKDRYYVGLPDLNNPGELVALMRDTQRFLFDFMDDPSPIKQAIDEATVAWWRYFQAATGVIHQWIDGYVYWMGIWSDSPSIDLQCDFNVMISPQMFDEYFLPGLEQQTRWVERTIFHLDGPEAIRHLDSLLALPRLDGIQWVPGDGKPPMSKWVPLLRRIQAHGRKVVALCEPWEIETMVNELEPEGLLLQTYCDTEAEARDLLAKVPTWMKRKQWVVA